MTEPPWLIWARELQAISQTGLHFAGSPYDSERYASLHALAVRMMTAQTTVPAKEVEAIFNAEMGYATPKVEVRGAVFDHEGRLLMVREVEDHGRWTVPGGWAALSHQADILLSPASQPDAATCDSNGLAGLPYR